MLTLLLLVLYQDDSSAQMQPEPATITQARKLAITGSSTRSPPDDR